MYVHVCACGCHCVGEVPVCWAPLLQLSIVCVMQVCHVMCVVFVHVYKGADLASELLRRSLREDGIGQETSV